MIYFLLPNVNPFSIENLKCNKSMEKPEPYISNTLSYYLYQIKIKIDNYDKEWDLYKKYTNPFEYINTHIPNKNKCISKYKPLSRSYFKMIEIIDTFNLIEMNKESITTFHLAEGPGGFIEAFVNKRKNSKDKYIGITLLDDKDDYNIPAWKKSEIFLKNNKNVYIESGKDNTGNILSYENLEYIINKYEKFDIITADGGFDFSMDFNSQEINITQLLYAQICYALCLQKKDGCFILKLFDCFMKHTIDMLYLLSSMYGEVYISKPQTSRYANSEKYIICKGFLYDNEVNKQNLMKILVEIINLKEKEYINSFFDLKLSNYFIKKIEEYNSIFGQQQIETINNTLNLIHNSNNSEKIDQLIKNNIQRSISWCEKYNVPHNVICQTNIFLSNNEIELN